jgi:thiamine-monophosphate kinase
MDAPEAQLIERYFRELGARREDVVLGIGDDAAVLRLPAAAALVLTTDALVEGVHFLPGAPARSLGHRALAVNLSDIAAMGANPCWALLALNLPALDARWLEEFAAGFGALARAHGVALVGGNLSGGALSITVQLAGVLPVGEGLRRDGARAGDDLYVSGSVGDAAAGLKWLQGELTATPTVGALLQQRFEYPTARVALGAGLRDLASACIDVSDGLYADAGRLLRASGCNARIEIERLPLSDALREACGSAAWHMGLQGGEDYELCFSAPAAHSAAIAALGVRTATAITRIGSIEAAGAAAGTAPGGIECKLHNAVMQFSASGFDHFDS